MLPHAQSVDSIVLEQILDFSISNIVLWCLEGALESPRMLKSIQLQAQMVNFMYRVANVNVAVIHEAPDVLAQQTLSIPPKDCTRYQ